MATAQLDVDSNKFNLPVVKASAGPDGIVVSKLRNDGWVTLDPGFLTTAQCESKITYIDGKHSILRYCGYPIEQLCENSDFLEVAWLLRHGELPSRAEYEQFCADINHKTMVGEDFRTFMGSFPRSAHPMSVLASAINALATFHPDTTDISDNDQLDEAAKIIMAKARTIVSYIFRRRRDEPMLYPDYARGYVDDFLRMCFAVPYEPFESDPLYVHALGRLLIIHADHEQNCSTSVVRIAGSAHANLYSAVAAGVNALSGPLHGGANEAVLRFVIPASLWPSSCVMPRRMARRFPALATVYTSRMIRARRLPGRIWKRSWSAKIRRSCRLTSARCSPWPPSLKILR